MRTSCACLDPSAYSGCSASRREYALNWVGWSFSGLWEHVTITFISGLRKKYEPELCNAQDDLPPPFQRELCELFSVTRRVDDFGRVATFFAVAIGRN